MNRIRAARLERGWSQDQLAARASLSPRTIHAVEKGKNCRQATKRSVLLALGVSWELRNEYFLEKQVLRAGQLTRSALRA